MRARPLASLIAATVMMTAALLACSSGDPGSLAQGEPDSEEEAIKGGNCEKSRSPHCPDANVGNPTVAPDASAAPSATCTAFTYSLWEPCQPDDTQTRTVVMASPAGCTGGARYLLQACTYVPPAAGACTSFTYSAYGACQPNNTQTRTVASSSPAGCMGGSPVLSQACAYTAPAVMCTSFTYSAYGACQTNSTQSRTVTSSSPAGCTGGSPALSRACTYTPPAVTCTSFTYSAYGACQPNNTQTRMVTSSSPAGCSGGSPVVSQSCTYIDGAALYTQYCSGCHGTSKKGASVARIQGAIDNNVGAMGSYFGPNGSNPLTPAQVSAISAAP